MTPASGQAVAPPGVDRTHRDHIRIRTYRDGDAALLRRMSAEVSARSLYHRFFAGVTGIPDSYLDSLTDVDHRDHAALVALRGDDHAIAIAEYRRDADHPSLADLGILVADQWQRRGVGGLLLDALGELALTHGITAFKADVLHDNLPARAAIRRHRPGAPATIGDGGVNHYLLDAERRRDPNSSSSRRSVPGPRRSGAHRRGSG